MSRLLLYDSNMSYSSFTNLEIKEKFGVEQAYEDGLFSDVPPCEVRDLLKQNQIFIDFRLKKVYKNSV